MARMSPTEIVMFEQVLQKYSNDLELVQVDLPPPSEGWIFNLPSLANLKDLAIDFNPTYYFHPNGKLLFDDHDVMDFGSFCPTLRILTVNLYIIAENKIQDEWKKNQRCFKLLFPPGIVCNSLQRLNIPYVNGKKGCKVSRIIEQISVMFPNVHNKWVTLARNKATATEQKRLCQERKEFNKKTHVESLMELRPRKK
jgi:hypothetical protein